MENNKEKGGTANDQVHITRVFDAPRELVFKAWTDPEHLLKWYAPTGCSISFPQIDMKNGGSFLSCIVIPNGKECWCKGIYKEVLYPELIVHTMAVSDEHGNLISAEDAGMDPEWPEETTLTITFEDLDGKTMLILHQTVSEALAKRTGAYPSWLIMFDRLADLLKEN
ncbi:SRPBCC domain-containing protein [Daejeonella sp.]|uniref:SRPBCC family protein n=1 Tax=Daejeonella sp. TaxID=2805397 RepID=UPI0030BFAAD0